MNNKDTSSASDFLTPQSMLTPGAAGAMVLLCTNTMYQQFGWEPKYCAFFLSALLGLLILKELKTQLIYKPIYYVFNTILIFTISLGGNSVGQNVTASTMTSETVVASSEVVTTAQPVKSTKVTPKQPRWSNNESYKIYRKTDNPLPKTSQKPKVIPKIVAPKTAAPKQARASREFFNSWL